MLDSGVLDFNDTSCTSSCFKSYNIRNRSSWVDFVFFWPPESPPGSILLNKQMNSPVWRRYIGVGCILRSTTVISWYVDCRNKNNIFIHNNRLTVYLVQRNHTGIAPFKFFISFHREAMPSSRGGTGFDSHRRDTRYCSYSTIARHLHEDIFTQQQHLCLSSDLLFKLGSSLRDSRLWLLASHWGTLKGQRY